MRKGRDCQWNQPQQVRHLSQATLDDNISVPAASPSTPAGTSMDIDSSLQLPSNQPDFSQQVSTANTMSSEVLTTPLPIDPTLTTVSGSDFNINVIFSPNSADPFMSFTQDFDFGFGSWEAFAGGSDGTSPEKLLYGWDWSRTEELENLARYETRARNTPVPEPQPEANLDHQILENSSSGTHSNGAFNGVARVGSPANEVDHPLRSAYEESAYYWKPRALDNVQDTNSMSNLLTLVEAIKEQSSLQLPSTGVRINALSTGDRDRILALLYQTQSRTRGVYNEKDIPIFPSSVVFDWFIQLYFQHFHPQNPILHLPTFDPRTTETVLLLAIVTAGGLFAPQREVQRFANGLLEMLRRSMAYHFEADNTRTRQIQSIQAHHISLVLGCWSGNRRGMELAEAMRCTILSMFRRGAWFSKSGYKNAPIRKVEGTEAQWREWIREEEKKRVMYFHVMMECQMGMFYDISSCMSYAELSAPMLFSESLWTSSSARQWGTRWNEEISNRIIIEGAPQPGFNEYLRKFLTNPQNTPSTNASGSPLSHNFVLLALQILTWEFNQLQTVMELEVDEQHEGFGHTSVNSRRHELERLLRIWEKTHEVSPIDEDVGVELFFHLVSLNLFANLDSMRLLTGREDHVGGRRVYPQLLRWRMQPASRRALWHAGQVTRIVRQRLQKSTSGSRLLWAPAALHQACLVLWSYGVLSAIRREQLRLRSMNVGQVPAIPVQVDHSDQNDPDVRGFLEFGEGEPCLSRVDGTSVLIDTPEAVAFECAGILDAKETVMDSGLLGENIGKVLRTLGSRTETFTSWLKKNWAKGS